MMVLKEMENGHGLVLICVTVIVFFQTGPTSGEYIASYRLLHKVKNMQSQDLQGWKQAPILHALEKILLSLVPLQILI
ncbi:MAG: hypothetical protein MJE68_08555 [Proteobacteria bacterium]|nr:hypothetical protein [Pseudomonadota bacterium]